MNLPVIQPARPEGQPPIFARIGIVGLGLIGGSIALAARQLWPTSLVIAVDNKDVLETAMRLHAIDVAADDLIVLAEADLVILAAPVRQNLALLAQLDEHVRQPAVVTDTGSTKRDDRRQRPRRCRRAFHVRRRPSARRRGGERARARAARSVQGPAVAVHARPATAPATRSTSCWRSSRALGAEPRVMDVAAHDRLLAFLSHLPQLTASALMQVVGDAVGDDGLALAGRGLVDTTRLASSPAEIWKDIAATNADEIGPALDTLIAVLQELRADLRDGRSALEQVFDARPARGANGSSRARRYNRRR